MGFNQQDIYIIIYIVIEPVTDGNGFFQKRDLHMSNRKNPGNTKYVFDGHWFMEIDGNC